MAFYWNESQYCLGCGEDLDRNAPYCSYCVQESLDLEREEAAAASHDEDDYIPF